MFSPYDPGRCSGPPEDCYPPEGGELEDLKVYRVHAKSEEEINPDVLYALLAEENDCTPEKAESDLEAELYESAEEPEPDYPDPDDYYDDPADDYIYEGY